jgi:hypothetical protein
VYFEVVIDALRELADEARQEVLWAASTGPEVSSLSECVCRLFDDSGLGRELESDHDVYSADVDERLRSLRAVLSKVDHRQPVPVLLRNPGVVRARLIASSILQRINEITYDDGA